MRQTPTPSVEVMDATREYADTGALATEIGDASTRSALCASSHGHGRGRSRGHGGRGPGAGERG